MRISELLGVAVLVTCQIAMADHTVETYETENGTVSFHSCDAPKVHETTMPENLIEWNIRPNESAKDKIAIYGTFPSAINTVPFDNLYAVISTNEYFQFPIVTYPDFLVSTDFDKAQGTFGFITNVPGFKNVVLKFHYKKRDGCADDVYVYTAKAPQSNT